LPVCWRYQPLLLAAVQETVPTLGRMLALAGGDEELARLVVPLLQDTLASQTAGADAEVMPGPGAAPARAASAPSCAALLNACRRLLVAAAVPMLRCCVAPAPAGVCCGRAQPGQHGGVLRAARQPLGV
jgi:hypothetical protein